jgi:hypothetical protein
MLFNFKELYALKGGTSKMEEFEEEFDEDDDEIELEEDEF